jgi:hypothetical protein
MPDIPEPVIAFLAALGTVAAVCSVAGVVVFIGFWLMELVDWATGEGEE